MIQHKKLPRRGLLALAGSRVPFRVVLDKPCPAADGRPVIFAANHSNSFDIPIALRAAAPYPLVLLGKQRLSFAERTFFFLNGTVWVDRADRADTRRVKDELVGLLRRGRSVLWFPEGTWNLTDALLMLPMKWGIIEVAQRAGALILPLALDYDRADMTCTVRFGEPFDPAGFADKGEAIGALRDAMATLRWELFCLRPRADRAAMDLAAERAALRRAIDEYPPLEWDKEQRVIYWPHETVEALPANLIPRRQNAFLFSKHWSG